MTKDELTLEYEALKNKATELEVKNSELAETIKMQHHLAEAVDAKDREIVKLKQDIKKQIDQAVEDVQKEGGAKVATSEESARRKIAELEETQKKLENHVQYQRRLIDRYKQAFWSTCKATQGQLEIAVELGACIDRDLK